MAFARGALVLFLAACQGAIGETPPPIDPPDVPPVTEAFEPLVAGLRTMTPAQYAASVRELLGLEAGDEAITSFGQWPTSIAAARGGFSPTSVETYERIAGEAARHVFSDAARRDVLLACTPSPECSRSFVARVGRLAFRRALTDEEVDRYAALADNIGADLGDPYRGLEFALTGLLQSPHFLYRVELGTEDPSDPRRLVYTDHEMATRLAFLVWNQGPDDELIAAAEAGRLSRAEDIEARAALMLEDARARSGMRDFLADLLDASAIETLEKDPPSSFRPSMKPSPTPCTRSFCGRRRTR